MTAKFEAVPAACFLLSLQCLPPASCLLNPVVPAACLLPPVVPAFIGVGERELRIPLLGGRVQSGERGLNVIVPRASSHGRLLVVAAMSALRGVQAAVGALELDSFVVDQCRIDLRRGQGDVSIDGEISSLGTPLHYRVERDALRVVMPA